ncbi:MAG: SDR family oxidoreductase [Candidatus Hydrogenedentes bacterium]|nr:SDR family oxidoreductase [Candidatus Hydrogenedentota bacterium]
MLSIDLSDKVAVVTGATGELGREMVRALAEAGANVAVCYHQNETKAYELVEEVEDFGARGVVVQADVTDFDSILAMRDRVIEVLGPVDIIVNNAVVQYKWVHVLEQALEDYESQFRSSVLHNVFMAKAFVPSMIERKWGRVIGINTECVMQCWENQSAYDSGKRGMDGVLRVLAREVGPYGITVNQVAPGWTLSENRFEGHGEYEEDYRKRIPLQRRGTDQEISDLASYISGAYIPVCGGSVMPAI